MKLKVLSYNIHKGYDWKMQNYFLQDMKQLIQSSEADIVFLQEVVGENLHYRRKGLVDSQFEFLADSIWKHYSYAQNALYDHGHHGNLILSRYPIESWENINLSTNTLERRGLLVCKIRISAEIYVYAACVHLNLLHSGRMRQYQMIKDKISSLNLSDQPPVIIAGDFNDWNKKAHHVFEEELGMTETYKRHHGHLAKTFPAQYPMLSLDRIYVKNLQVREAKVINPLGLYHLSDHLPLFCDLETL